MNFANNLFRKTGLLLLALSFGTAHAADIKLATTPWPPFTGEKGQPRIVIELVEEALRRADLTSTVTQVEEGTLTTLLKEKKFDGSPAMWRDKDRESFLEYSAPLLENRLILVGKKGSNVSANTLSELKGKRVGIVTGYAYGDEVAQATDVQFVKGPSHQANIDKLRRGELDYLLVEDLLMQHLLIHQTKEIESNLQIGITPLVKRSLHFALRKDLPKSAEIIQKFNSRLKSMLSDGTYNRILQLNWIRADVDGDGKMELVSQTNRVGSTPPSHDYSIFYSSKDPVAPTPRYWINGQAYPDWDHVPSQYKVDELTRREKSNPLLQLKF